MLEFLVTLKGSANHLILRKEFVKVFNNCNKYGISISDIRCCGGLFADDIVLCAPTRSQLKKLLKFASKWARNNEMQFGINKCASQNSTRGSFKISL